MWGITSENPQALQEATAGWGLEHTQLIGDPENKIIDNIKAKFLPDLVIQEPNDKYPKGMAQPGELAFVKDKVVFAWTKQPGILNMGGAVGRPNVGKIWKMVSEQVE